MKAYVFPGQAAQFEGMGKDMYEASEQARDLFHQANDILGTDFTRIMFEGSAEELRQTIHTQPAVFIHSVIKAKMAGDDFQPDVVAGHSLGEFSALVAAGALSFEEGLKMVHTRAKHMQQACEQNPGTMAAILGMEDADVEKVCEGIDGIVVAANYNCPGQLVISGEETAVGEAAKALAEAGARRTVMLEVGGAFHSPLMAPAYDALEAAVDGASIQSPTCPIYQNVNARPTQDPATIAKNLKAQLTAPVRWTQTMKNMIANGVTEFVEVGGSGRTLQSFVRKVDRSLATSNL